MLEKREFYIDGRWVAPAEANDLDVINPSSEEPCAVISLGSQADTDAAVNAANAAFEGWAFTPKDERIAVVERLAEIYESRSDEMAETISLEMGAPIDMAKAQQAAAGDKHIRTFLRVAKDFEFERMIGDHASTDRIVYEPVGVCALITPWNWPMNQVTLKVIPALLARAAPWC